MTILMNNDRVIMIIVIVIFIIVGYAKCMQLSRNM